MNIKKIVSHVDRFAALLSLFLAIAIIIVIYCFSGPVQFSSILSLILFTLVTLVSTVYFLRPDIINFRDDKGQGKIVQALLTKKVEGFDKSDKSWFWERLTPLKHFWIFIRFIVKYILFNYPRDIIYTHIVFIPLVLGLSLTKFVQITNINLLFTIFGGISILSASFEYIKQANQSIKKDLTREWQRWIDIDFDFADFCRFINRQSNENDYSREDKSSINHISNLLSDLGQAIIEGKEVKQNERNNLRAVTVKVDRPYSFNDLETYIFSVGEKENAKNKENRTIPHEKHYRFALKKYLETKKRKLKQKREKFNFNQSNIFVRLVDAIFTDGSSLLQHQIALKNLQSRETKKGEKEPLRFKDILEDWEVELNRSLLEGVIDTI